MWWICSVGTSNSSLPDNLLLVQSYKIVVEDEFVDCVCRPNQSFCTFSSIHHSEVSHDLNSTDAHLGMDIDVLNS